MSSHCFRLFRELDRELEDIPNVLSSLGIDFSGVMGSEHLVEINCKPLDDWEPLIWGESGHPGESKTFRTTKVGSLTLREVKSLITSSNDTYL
jgi:hypothetical protein